MDSKSVLKSYVAAQNNYEHRFNCIICWCPKLRMVYGSCQHRLCEDCLYTKSGTRRANLSCCPTCQKPDAFPLISPSIPEDNIEVQKQIGVLSCPNRDCGAEMWSWELTEHLECCSGQILRPKIIKANTECKSSTNVFVTKSRRCKDSRSQNTDDKKYPLRSLKRRRSRRRGKRKNNKVNSSEGN